MAKSPYNPEEYNATVYMQPAKKRSAFSGPILFVIVVVAAIFVLSIAFRINRIEVVGNEHYTSDEIIRAINIEQGDNLFFFDQFGAVSRVFAKLPYVEEVSISRHLPDRVTIEITESKAMAYLPIGAELWTIDHDCKVLGIAAEGEEGSLIQVTGFKPGTLFIGEPLSTEDGSTRAVDFLSAILNQIQGRGMTEQVKKIDFTDVNNVSISYGGKYTFKLGDPYNTAHKFGMIEYALTQLKEGDIGIIDVSSDVNAEFTPY